MDHGDRPLKMPRLQTLGTSPSGTCPAALASVLLAHLPSRAEAMSWVQALTSSEDGRRCTAAAFLSYRRLLLLVREARREHQSSSCQCGMHLSETEPAPTRGADAPRGDAGVVMRVDEILGYTKLVCAASWQAIHSKDKHWSEVSGHWRESFAVGCMLRGVMLLLAATEERQDTPALGQGQGEGGGLGAVHSILSKLAVPEWCLQGGVSGEPGGEADGAGSEEALEMSLEREMLGWLSGRSEAVHVEGDEKTGSGDQGAAAGRAGAGVGEEGRGDGQWWEDGEAALTVQVSVLRWLDLALLVGGKQARVRVHAMVRACTVLAGGHSEAGWRVDGERGAGRCQEVYGGGMEEKVEWGGTSMKGAGEGEMGQVDGAVGGGDGGCAGGGAEGGGNGGREGGGAEVERREAPSLAAFKIEFLDARKPVVITGVVDEWPALEKWSDLRYLQRLAGPRTVPVEVGRHYLEDSWTQKLMPLSDFVDSILGGSGGSSDGGRGGEGGSSGGAGGGSGAGKTGYLAQHDLFEQVPELRADIIIPDYTALSRESESGGSLDEPVTNAWLGPGGTISPLHYDEYENLFVQVVGRKYIRLYAPCQTPRLYPRSSSRDYNSSHVSVEEVDEAKFPLFKSAPYSEVVLAPGQTLYIPRGHWHYVRSLEPSFSVSFWWR